MWAVFHGTVGGITRAVAMLGRVMQDEHRFLESRPLMLSVAPVMIFLLAVADDGATSGGEPRSEALSGTRPPRGLVIVLRPADVDELTRTALARVTGELTAADFQTAFVTLDARQDPTTQVETVAPESHAVAAFAIAHIGDPQGHTIAIWVSDRVGRRTTIVRMKMQGDDVSQDAAVLALNAIEIIRVSLAGLWPTQPPATETAPPPPASATAVSPGSPGMQFTVGLGIAAQQDLGLPSPEWMGSITARTTWPSGLGIKAEVTGLGPALTLDGQYGTAAVHRQLAALGLSWAFVRRMRVQSFVVVSAGVAHLNGKGATTDSTRAVARSGDAWSALGAAGISAAVALAGRLWLVGELDGIATVPPLVIRIAGTDTKPFSRPGVLANVGLHVGF
jgi:hypothetical protein